MSITITLNYATTAEAHAALARLAGPTTPAEAALRHAPIVDAAREAVATAVEAKNAAAADKERKIAEGKAAAAEKVKAEAKVVDYATLSAAVLKLMKVDADAPGVIAKSLGFETFKKMKEAENAAEIFAKALAAVEAKLAEVEGAGV